MRILSPLLCLALGAVCAEEAVRLARRSPAARAEIARVKPTRLEPATRERLGRLDEDVLITYFGSPFERLPGALRDLRQETLELLAGLEQASGGRLRGQVLEPERDPGAAAFAAALGVEPRRLRSVERDAWSEREVYSTLSIAQGARPRSAIEGVAAEHRGLLPAWILAHLDEQRSPSRPRLALCAGTGAGGGRSFRRLAERLAARGELARADPRAPFEPRADVLFWLDPELGPPSPSPEGRARELDAFFERGGSVVLALSAWQARPSEKGGSTLERSGSPAEALLAELGLRTLPGVVLDLQCETRSTPRGREAEPWRIRCIAPSQDFRALRGQPNGTLVFEAPLALLPDERRLDGRAWDFRPLASAGPEAWIQAGGAAEVLSPSSGSPAPKAALAALLSPRDARKGALVVLGSSSPFEDRELEREDAAHLALATVLLDSLAGTSRRAAARMQPPLTAPLAPLAASERLAWRAVCVGGPPLALLLAALLRRRARRGRGTGVARPLGLGAALAAGGFAALAAAVWAARALPAARADLTAEELHSLSGETRALAARLPGKLRAELVFPRDLPAELRPLPARAEDLLRSIQRARAGSLEMLRRAPEDLPSSELADLERRGVRPWTVSSREGDATRVRSVRAALILAAQGREEVLPFQGAASAEHLELRLALALARLAGEPRARGRVAIACDTPRLSPAEAHERYQRRGLFAPGGADVYALARETLAANDLRLIPVDPSSPFVPEDVDLLVWLQPRRSAGPMLAALVAHLRRGGSALVAAQHFQVRSRQVAAGAFRTVHWPEPQFPDVDHLYLSALGAGLAREVLCDASFAALELPTEVERPGEGRDFVRQASAQPFQIRASAARFDSRSPLVRGFGDQLFLCGNRWVLDRARLAQLGIQATALMSTSERAWSIDWKGGLLDPAALAAPARALEGPQPLAVLLEGVFPPLEGETAPAPPGKLLLIGCSAMFQDEHLAREGFRADHLLVDAAATLALGEDFGRIAARRAVARGFEPPAPEERLWLRAFAIGSFPALLALAALSWRLALARAAHRARAGREPPGGAA